MIIERIKKRNGAIVPFDQGKIEQAMGKAFLSLGTPASSQLLRELTQAVIDSLEPKFSDRIPEVEDIQDTVEKTLADAGHFDVAKAYILYRKEHAKEREVKKQENIEKADRHEFTVIKRDGSSAPFDIKEIGRTLTSIARKYPKFDADIEGILEDCKTGIYDRITTKEINQVALMAIKARVERDPVYSKMAARFLINDLYKEVLGCDELDEHFEKTYREQFVEKMKYGVEDKRVDERLLEFDLDALAEAIVVERDANLEYLGAQTLHDRYFLRDHNQMHFETPQAFWMRVAMGLALGEGRQAPLWAQPKERTEWAISFYNILSELRYVSSTPTLLHAGTPLPQMSSCYLSTVEDDLHHIFKCIGDNAQLSKWSGGIGQDWTDIRATNALIKSINVPSQGVVPFLKIVDSTTASINRSGKRRGATCVYLETWHMDIESFLELRKNTGDDRRRTHDTNTSNWIPDLFMKRVIEDGDWTLFSPEEVPDLHHIYGKEFERRYEEYERKADAGEINMFKRIKAATLWRKMITMLYETGHPWITFKDPCNIRSPQDHTGVIHCSNLCTEITLNTSREETAVCNLGSVNLSRHLTDGKVDWDLLQETVEIAMRMLDNVIDVNFYPTKEAETSNLRHRPVGIGIMGYQDVLFKLGLRFESEEAVELSDELMEFVSYHAIFGSSKLAKERGAYSSYRGSKWDRNLFPIDTFILLEEERGMSTGIPRTAHLDWSPVRDHVKKYGMRNSNCLAIAPTATIANISGCLPSIEPIYKNLYVKSNFSGDFTVINRYLVSELKQRGLWTRDVFEKLKYYEGSVQNIQEIPVEIRGRYKEVFEIDSHWIVRHAARRAKWIDQSQSLNIFTASESGSFIADVYTEAWRSGLKTTYYLRTLAASAIEKSTIDINKDYEAPTDEIKEEVQTVAAPVSAAKVIHIAEGGICESCQ